MSTETPKPKKPKKPKRKGGKKGKKKEEKAKKLAKKKGEKPPKALRKTKAKPASEAPVMAVGAPAPVGAYPHARRVGDLLFLSGVGPRQAGTNAIPGGPIEDEGGERLDYDVAAQTRATIENVKTILEASGSSLAKVVDVTVFLVDMKRDFAAYNAVYKDYFGDIQATRTTLGISALPTPIAVELKVLARP